MREIDMYIQFRSSQPGNHVLILRTQGESYTMLCEDCDKLHRIIDAGKLDEQQFCETPIEYGYTRMQFSKQYIDKAIPALILNGYHPVFRDMIYCDASTKKKAVQLELNFT